jgi:hypothetical protein
LPSGAQYQTIATHPITDLSLLSYLILHPPWKTQFLAPMAICAKKQVGLTAIFDNHFPTVLQESARPDKS